MEPEWEGEEAGGSAGRLDPAGAAGAVPGRRDEGPQARRGARAQRQAGGDAGPQARRGRRGPAAA